MNCPSIDGMNHYLLQEIARHLRPRTIRAIFGTDKVKNAVHCTDLPDDGRLEVRIILNAKLYRHSLGECGASKLYLSVCLTFCVSVKFLRHVSRLIWVGF